MGLLTSTENKCFQRWKHRVHDKHTRREKDPMACTRKSLRLDRATWGGTPSCIQGRVAQNTKHKTKQKTKQNVLNLLHGARKVFYLCFIFPARRFIGGNIQHGKQCGSGSHAGARDAAHWGAGHARGLPGQAAGAYASSYASCIYHISKGAILVIHRESTVPTVEVVLQLKLSAFTCRTEIAHRYRIYFYI